MEALVLNSTDLPLHVGFLTSDDTLYALDVAAPGSITPMLLKGPEAAGDQGVVFFAGYVEPSRDAQTVASGHVSNYSSLTGNSGKADGLPVYTGSWLTPGLHAINAPYLESLEYGQADDSGAQTAAAVEAARYPPWTALATIMDTPATMTVRMNAEGTRVLDEPRAVISEGDGAGIRLAASVDGDGIFQVAITPAPRRTWASRVPLWVFACIIAVSLFAALAPWLYALYASHFGPTLQSHIALANGHVRPAESRGTHHGLGVARVARV